MRCQVVNVLRRKPFDWTYLPGSGQQQVVLQAAIPVAGYYYVQLWVRVHELSFSSTQSVEFNLYETFPCEDDSREFTKTSVFARVSFGSTTTPPALLSVSATDPGAFLKLVLDGYQSGASPGTFYTELSAALVLRSAQ